MNREEFFLTLAEHHSGNEEEAERIYEAFKPKIEQLEQRVKELDIKASVWESKFKTASMMFKKWDEENQVLRDEVDRLRGEK